MTFLQPWLLAALPLISLPIIIHLINQRRYQTMRWGAMMFLLQANRMSRGYARLRQWLILLARTLAVAALVFAVSRPLASGWLGLAGGGRADTTLVLLDRSPSMQQQGAGVVLSKFETGRRQLAQALQKLGSLRWVLIDSATNTPVELESPAALLELPSAAPASSASDLPIMLQAARDYIAANQTGRTEVWICSDLRANDWNSDSGRWSALRDRFLEFPQGVRFHLLAYPQAADDNLSIRVTDLRRRPSPEGAELLVSLLVQRETPGAPVTVPLQFEIDGARSELTIELTGKQHALKDYRIALAADQRRGWGRASIPADANSADNDFYFVFDDPPPRRALIVADDPQAAHPLELAASIATDPTWQCLAEVIPQEQLASVAWEQIALLLWQAPLPREADAGLVQDFAARGGRVVFLPPRAATDNELFGVRWQTWVEPAEELAVESWRGDQDLLAHTLSGAALPVGQLKVRHYCALAGEVTPIAQLTGGAPLLARVATDQGGVYFCATTPAPQDSSLAAEGVVLYVAIQRALSDGAAMLGDTRQLIAGPPAAGLPTTWDRLSATDDAVSTEYAHHRGVYAAGERLLAVNRPAAEDQAAILSDAQVSELFRGLDLVRVVDRAGNVNALIQEIWRLFLATMMVMLLLEAALCLPRIKPAAEVARSWRPTPLGASRDTDSASRRERLGKESVRSHR